MPRSGGHGVAVVLGMELLTTGNLVTLGLLVRAVFALRIAGLMNVCALVAVYVVWLRFVPEGDLLAAATDA